MNQDRLNADALSVALADEAIGHTVELHGSVPSTMPLAKSLANDPSIASGAVVMAEEQTAGRGRLERHWETPYGQALLMTVVLKRPGLKPSSLDFPPSYLPMAASLAIRDAVIAVAPSLADRTAIKWPNDVLIDCCGRMNGETAVPADWRKVAGILIETAYAGSSMAYALIGMGINANQDQAVLPPIRQGGLAATSIRQHVTERIDRTALAIALCKQLGHWLAAARFADGEALYRAWRTQLLTSGYHVTIRSHGNAPIVSGTIENVDRAGRLFVRDEADKEHIFNAGDVSLHL